jgi:hypothetical protein
MSDPWAELDRLAQLVLDRSHYTGPYEQQMATLWFQIRPEYDQVCAELRQARSVITLHQQNGCGIQLWKEGEYDRVRAERDALAALLRSVWEDGWEFDEDELRLFVAAGQAEEAT